MKRKNKPFRFYLNANLYYLFKLDCIKKGYSMSQAINNLMYNQIRLTDTYNIVDDVTNDVINAKIAKNIKDLNSMINK